MTAQLWRILGGSFILVVVGIALWTGRRLRARNMSLPPDGAGRFRSEGGI